MLLSQLNIRILLRNWFCLATVVMKRRPVVTPPRKQLRKLWLLVDLASDHQPPRFRMEETLLRQPQDTGKRQDKEQTLIAWTLMMARGSGYCRNLLCSRFTKTTLIPIKKKKKQAKMGRYIDKSGYRLHHIITIIYYMFCSSSTNDATPGFLGLIEHWNVFGRLHSVLLRNFQTLYRVERALPYGPG